MVLATRLPLQAEKEAQVKRFAREEAERIKQEETERTQVSAEAKIKRRSPPGQDADSSVLELHASYGLDDSLVDADHSDKQSEYNLAERVRPRGSQLKLESDMSGDDARAARARLTEKSGKGSGPRRASALSRLGQKSDASSKNESMQSRNDRATELRNRMLKARSHQSRDQIKYVLKLRNKKAQVR